LSRCDVIGHFFSFEMVTVVVNLFDSTLGVK
jgi:hypothetical protein